MQHYVWQGVQHFYLIDNNSTDGTAELLAPHVACGTVSYFLRPKRHAQIQHYNQVVLEFRFFRFRARTTTRWF